MRAAIPAPRTTNTRQATISSRIGNRVNRHFLTITSWLGTIAAAAVAMLLRDWSTDRVQRLECTKAPVDDFNLVPGAPSPRQGPPQRPPPTRRQRWGRCRVERRDRAQGGNNPRRKPQARACSTFHGPQKPATVAFATHLEGQNGLSAGPPVSDINGQPGGDVI